MTNKKKRVTASNAKKGMIVVIDGLSDPKWNGIRIQILSKCASDVRGILMDHVSNERRIGDKVWFSYRYLYEAKPQGLEEYFRRLVGISGK